MQAEHSTPPQSGVRRLPARRPPWVFASLAVLGCGGGDLVLPSDNGATALAVMAGAGQSGTAGKGLADPIVVKVTDAQGQPVSGARRLCPGCRCRRIDLPTP